MQYVMQFAIILGVTFIGELFGYLIPLPIPGSIYGLVIMLLALQFKVIKLEQVKACGAFLVEIMSVMFIPAGVGLTLYWDQLQPILLPVSIITVATTLIVMVVTGKTTQALIGEEK